MSPTTHTVEMSQIGDLNERLRAYRPLRVTATDLGLEGAPTEATPVGSLRDDAVLVKLSWDGSPEYPYIYGHFASGASSDGSTVELHTPALRELSHRLAAHHLWGVGSAPDPRTR